MIKHAEILKGSKMNNYVEMPSGLILPEHSAEDYYRKMQLPKGIDLFAGCGGFSCGYISAGFEVVAAVDSDPEATMTYMTNLGSYPCKFHFMTDEDAQAMEKTVQKCLSCKKGTIKTMPISGSGWISGQYGAKGVGHFFLGDIRKLTGAEILNAVEMKRGEIDCVFGGPPCQGFSTSGKRNVMDPRNSLVFEFARLVCEIRPKTMVFENVPNILNMVTPDGLPVMDVFCRILEDGGFNGYKSFLQSIKAQSGSLGLMSGATGKKKKKKAKSEQIDSKQMALF